MSITRMRWPAMQGFPPQTSGVFVMRSVMTVAMALNHVNSNMKVNSVQRRARRPKSNLSSPLAIAFHVFSVKKCQRDVLLPANNFDLRLGQLEFVPAGFAKEPATL